MELEIQDYHSPDIDSLWNWQPISNEEVFFLLELDIGYKGEEKSSIFQMRIATPEAIKIRSKKLPMIIPGHGIFIVTAFEWEKILKELKKIVKCCTCETWDESVLKLSRYFKWEYEDCRFIEDD